MKPISNPMELHELINSVEKGKRHLCVAIRNLLNFYEVFEMMSEESINKFRKVVKIPKTGVDEYIPQTDEIIDLYRRIEDERYKITFKLLMFSGLRIRHAVTLLNNYNPKRVMVSELHPNVARYPLFIDQKSKKAYLAYMPVEFVKELKAVNVTASGVEDYFSRRDLPAKYIRKWHYNFLMINNVPESVIDFIQGRRPITIGSKHYLAKVKQADEWYSRIVDKFPLQGDAV